MAGITVKVNGESRSVPEGTTLEGLALMLGLRTDRIAAELNGGIVPKAEYGDTVLKDGDCVELVNFVGGG